MKALIVESGLYALAYAVMPNGPFLQQFACGVIFIVTASIATLERQRRGA